MDSHQLPDPGETQVRLVALPEPEGEQDDDSGIEDELRVEESDSTIFVAFKGDIGDKDLPDKLEKILHGVPDLISMDSKHLRVQKVEPWNSVRVTFSIPREAAERLRLLAQGNNQQLRDLGILSVQIEGEGAINLAMGQNPGHEVRMNGPMAAASANSTMRIDANFALQNRTGLIRMNNPAATMMSQGPHVSSAMMAVAGSTDLQQRTPRPPSQQDALDPMVSGMTVQQQSHPSSSMAPQLHPMQTVVGNRQLNPANFQQFQQQARLPQHQQVSQGLRPSFTAPAQVPVPPGWNQLASGALQPPPAQASLGSVASNQQWKKSAMATGPLQQQFPQRPSLSAVQTPSHPPPPYPFGSQQAPQVHSNFPSMANANQFSTPQMKSMQGGPPRVLTPLQQPHLSKSPASSPSSFQQSSPASSPTVIQTQQQGMGPRGGQGNSLPQGFQQQPVGSPGRGGMLQQGNAAGNFMMQQNQGPQAIHTGGPKRLPPGFPTGQTNASFLQGQTPPSAAGSPANGSTTQQPGGTTGQGAGGPTNGSHNQMQGSHGGPNLMQANLLGLHNMTNQQTGGSGVNQVNISGLHGQSQQGPQSQILGMHQQIISSQGQMVNLQGQAPLNTQGQLVLSRNQLLSQGQMLGASSNLGQAPQRMTPPKQMIPSHNQMITSQGQNIMQQNPVMEQLMQGNKQGFNNQNPGGAMAGSSQIIRGPTPGLTNNMVQFSGQQGALSGNPSQGINMQSQVLRQTGPVQHLQQPHSETAGSDLGNVLSDISMQQTGNMNPQHLQNMPGNGGPGQHFAGHGLPFGSSFSQGGNGNPCGQNPSFPVNKDVTLTSPLLVNLLQSDISAGHFGVNSKQNSAAAKPKKKKPPRKKKTQQGDEHMNSSETRLEDSDQTGIVGEQLGALEGGQKLSDYTNRPPGYPAQGIDQRHLQQIPSQLMQLGGQQQSQSGQTQQPTPPQQMMMMLMMQQQQQDQKAVRLPVQQNIFNPRVSMNPELQRMPMQQGGNMPVMVNLQGPGSIPPSPDKQRLSMVSNTLGGNGRKMGFPESGQNPSGSPLGEGSTVTPIADIPELSTTSASQNSMASHLLISQNPMMMAGSKPGTSASLSLAQGTSPQQHSNSMAGTHVHHYQSIQTPSQSSRPKTPNRASPRPYYPQTPSNRPPSTEPSEISLSPERLNASIAGLFPPQINIPLPPRPTLNRNFDQQGLNPTTLKAIGQAPPGLTVNNQSAFLQHMSKMDNGAGKPTSGGNKRASPSNSRRSSPASSRKTTPSPGRQNAKAAKIVLGGPQNPGIVHSMEIQRSTLSGQTSMHNTSTVAPTIGHYPPNSVLSNTVPTDEGKESQSMVQETDNQTIHLIPKEQTTAELKTSVHQEVKLPSPEERAKKDPLYIATPKLSTAEDVTSVSPAMRDAPTSLSQLLDHSNAPNVNIKSSGPLSETPLMLAPTEDLKATEVAALPVDALNKESSCIPTPPQYTEAVQTRSDAMETNTNVPLNLPGSSLKRPGGPKTASSSLTPNQITVFVTSNPITTSASVSAPMASHLQPTLVPTVVTVPSVGSKVIVSEGQPPVQSTTRPQFITPVFFNSSSIIQVMKGAQQNTMPTTSNTNMMPQSVAVVGPLHISQNIQFPGPPSTTAASSSGSSLPTTRPAFINPVQATTQVTPSQSSPLPQLSAQIQSSSEDINTHMGTVSDLRSPASLQPSMSPAIDSNLDASLSKTYIEQAKMDNIGQNLLTRAYKKGSDPVDQIPENPDVNCTKVSGPGRTTPLTSHITTDNSSTSIVSTEPMASASSTPPELLPFSSPTPPLIISENDSEGTLADSINTTFDETVPEQILETVPSQNTVLEEGAASVPEKADANLQESMEIEPAEKLRPPSRRNSRVEEFPMHQDVLESGQRKRTSRPSSASSSAKESGASPSHPKRRKSK